MNGREGRSACDTAVTEGIMDLSYNRTEILTALPHSGSDLSRGDGDDCVVKALSRKTEAPPKGFCDHPGDA